VLMKYMWVVGEIGRKVEVNSREAIKVSPAPL